jgi:ArsR family transcriptional regulator, arsenate/arsenite/antimonite-responsive transcriptional repressor
MNNWSDLKHILKALAGVARLTIIYHLAREPEVTVTELTNRLNISQPLVSWHLRKLRRAGLIEMRKSGRQVYCTLNPQRFQMCLQQLEKLIDPAIIVEPVLTGPALIEADMRSDDK